MSDITERITLLNKDIAKKQKSIDDSIKEIELLNSGKMLSNQDLYKLLINLSSDITSYKGILYEIKEGKYMHILGGDGRSAAWDEQREGRVCMVRIDYIVDGYDQAHLIHEYMYRLHPYDYIRIHDIIGDTYEPKK